MKRVSMIMVCLLAMLAASTGVKAQEVTITLIPGWTWISCPMTEAIDFATALGDFTPMTGDAIKSQWGNAYYKNGRWAGSISEFYPGYGYKYYSNRPTPVTVTFNAQQPSSQVVVSTSEPMLITGNSAMGGGEVTTTDGTYILVKGLCWAAHENPTTDDFYEESESGVGTFSISMTELNIATTYYARAYAVTPNGTVYGDQKSFTTRDGIPEVSTDSITNILGNCATCWGTVTDNGGLNVTARGVCWSTTPNPTVSDSHTSDGSGLGDFSSFMGELTPNTTFYVRAYASTNQGTSYGEELYFTTLTNFIGIPTVITNPVTDIYGDGATFGGTVVDIGYPIGNGYELHGAERGVCWSTSPNPTINECHVNEWSEGKYDNQYYYGGNLFLGDYDLYISGLNPSTTYYVRAYAKNEDDIGYGNEVVFTTPAPLWSNGVLPGTFSVSSSQQVHFSQGNLQYKASTNTWRFGINQWSNVGGSYYVYSDGYEWPHACLINVGNVYSENGVQCENNSISSGYSGWIDLFGWGTSGYEHGAICYQPWSINETQSRYYAYGSSTSNLFDQTGLADWGYNPISNGGNQPNQWHTLTKGEWVYVFNTRNTASGIRYAKATVFGVKGVILLPDDWNASYYPLNNTNASSASFSSNVITSEQWNTLEQHGAVFLPETGVRHRWDPEYCADWNFGNDYEDCDEEFSFDPDGIFYWSSSYKDASKVWHLRFKESAVYTQDYSGRHNGMAVRLVCFITPNDDPTVTTNEVSDITPFHAICGGTMTDDGSNEATVRGVCWSTSPNPTISDAHTIDGYGMGSFSSNLTGLVPNTTYYVRAYAANRLSTVYGNEVSFTTPEGEREYVDLNLPSGTLWATCNVGADSPEDYGDYFAWGETLPKDTYNWSTYQHSNGGTSWQNPNLIKYCNNSSSGYNGFTDNLTILLPEDDAATANWGSSWRMPTEEEWQELLDNTTNTWTQQNGMNGWLFTASNGNSLFLPAAGYRYDSNLYNAGSDGDGSYWSSSLGTDDFSGAVSFDFGSGGFYLYDYDGRECGLSVRPVRSASQN